jgi:hypothetical protein
MNIKEALFKQRGTGFSEKYTANEFKKGVKDLKQGLKDGKEAYTKVRNAHKKVVEAQREKRATEIPEYKKTSHFVHFVLTIVTGGLWLLVWLFCGLSNAQHNSKVNRDISVAQFNMMFNQIRKDND